MSIQTNEELEKLRAAGAIVSLTLRTLSAAVRPGITTGELDEIAVGVLARHGARSSPALVYGFPRSVLISVNDEVVHGVPGSRVIQPGDLVKLDVTAEKDGYHADAAVCVAVPPAPKVARRLADCARTAFQRALEVARAGHRLYEIGRAVEREVRRSRFSVVRELCGHGIGRTIHEEPQVANYFDPSATQRLHEGLVITIEPLIAAGKGDVVVRADGWTVCTADGSLAAHHEHTLVITRGAPILLTA